MTDPIVDSTPMRRVKIIKDGVHTGEENRLSGYAAGEIATLRPELADALIAKGMAEPADGESIASAKTRSKARVAKSEQEAQKNRAGSAQDQFDSLPSEIRTLAREHGDEPVQMFLAGDSIEDIVNLYRAPGS